MKIQLSLPLFCSVCGGYSPIPCITEDEFIFCSHFCYQLYLVNKGHTISTLPKLTTVLQEATKQYEC